MGKWEMIDVCESLELLTFKSEEVPLTRPLAIFFFFMFIASCSRENDSFLFLWYWAIVFVVMFVIVGLVVGCKSKKREPLAIIGPTAIINSTSLDTASSTRRRKVNRRKKKGRISLEKDDGKVGKMIVSETQIGRGCDGTIVFEGIYLGHPVAIKRFVVGVRKVADRELRILMDSDSHTNITRVYDFEEANGFHYLALELCGCSLHDLIYYFSDIGEPVNDRALKFLREVEAQIEPPFLWENCRPTPLLLKLLREVVAGLAHLHHLGIVHRDLKPGNILITKERPLCAKISDMGISQKLDKDRASLGHDVSGRGTSGWQALEVLNGGRQTRAVDAFSLGCVLYFCLTGGGHPFGKPIERDVNIRDDVRDPFVLGEFPEAEDLLYFLLNREPDQRPDVQEVSFHPLFWSKGKKLSFIRDVSDKLELCKQSDVLDEINNIDVGGIWGNMLSTDLYNDLNNCVWRTYEFGIVSHLLRAIRNKYTHYGNLSPRLQVELGPIPDGFYSYFATTFPYLLVKVYRIIYNYWKDDEVFERYFNGSD